MKPSAILREAARRIDIGLNRYGCAAIDRAANDSSTNAYAYFRLLSPVGYYSAYWFSIPPTVESQKQRVLALLFAAAIAESEGQ